MDIYIGIDGYNTGATPTYFAGSSQTWVFSNEKWIESDVSRRGDSISPPLSSSLDANCLQSIIFSFGHPGYFTIITYPGCFGIIYNPDADLTYDGNTVKHVISYHDITRARREVESIFLLQA